MFEENFFPRTAERYRAAPLVEQRERYLVHLKETGAKRATLRKCANNQLSLVRLLNLKEGSRVRLSQIEDVAAIWSQPKGRRCEWPASPKARARFVNHSVRWLRFLGWLDEADQASHQHAAEVHAYEAWMRGDRGLSEETIRDYRAAADQFFDWLAATDIPFASVRIVDIDEAITDKKARGTCGRRAMHDYAQRLRAFFRFAEARGWCRAGLAAGIMAPRFIADEIVPKGIKRDDVLRLLASVRRDRPVDKRDRAILMLFVTYGLRAGEVAGLRPDDLDWENEVIRVRCPKPGRTHVWPLSPDAGNAILRYIREARPAGLGRNLFFTSHAPIRPVGRKTLGKIVRDRLAGIGIVTGRRGTCVAACGGPESSGSGHVYEGDWRLSRAPRPVLHSDLRQGQSRGSSRGGCSRSGGAGMTLHDTIEQYILWRQAHGAKFTSSGGILRRFLKYADGNARCDAVTSAQVLA